MDGGKEGKTAVKDARMQECKDKDFLHPCTVEWKATTKGKNLFRVYVVFYSTLLFRENGVYW